LYSVGLPPCSWGACMATCKASRAPHWQCLHRAVWVFCFIPCLASWHPCLQLLICTGLKPMQATVVHDCRGWCKLRAPAACCLTEVQHLQLVWLGLDCASMDTWGGWGGSSFVRHERKLEWQWCTQGMGMHVGCPCAAWLLCLDPAPGWACLHSDAMLCFLAIARYSSICSASIGVPRGCVVAHEQAWSKMQSGFLCRSSALQCADLR
jgi:hypothetical protein